MIKNKIFLNINYHKKQHSSIYQSTTDFINFIEKNENLKNKNIVDIGCGSGANLIILAKKYKSSFFLGIDKNKILIEIAKKYVKKYNLKNVKLICKDFKNINKKQLKLKADLVLSFHFISFNSLWFDKSLSLMEKLQPKSMAHSSLFFNGFAEAKIQVNDFKKKDFNHYDVFSVEKIKKYFEKKKYKKFKFKQFFPKKKIINLKKDRMGSYTINVKKKNLILSGPLLQPHGFIYASK